MSFLRVAAVIIVFCMGIVTSAPRKKRLTVAEPMSSYYHTNIGGDSGAYSFGYDVWDQATGNTQFRSEERYPNGTVVGHYGYVDASGEARVFKYIADERGYRVRSEGKINQPTESSTVGNLVQTSTQSEDSVTWTRPSKKKPQDNKDNVIQRRKYNNVQPLGYYSLY